MLPELAPIPEGADDDAWVAACQHVRSLCGWHIAPTITETIHVGGSGTDTLLLPTMHLLNVTAVTTKGVAVTAPQWKIDGQVRPGFATDDPATIGWFGVYGYRWPDAWTPVDLTITHGHPSCPEELLDVIRAYAARPAAALSGRKWVAGPFQLDASAAPLSDEQQTALARYTLPPRP